MYIEWLKFHVQPELRSQFIQKDAELWTPYLAQNSAFVRKEIWLDPNHPDEVATIVWWSNREQWKAIPAEEMEAIAQQFETALGKGTYELIEEREWLQES